MSSVAVALTCIEGMFSRFFQAWQTLEIGPPSEVPRHVEIGGAITEARNRCVRWFLEETKARYLLFVDQDHKLPPNLLERVANYEDPVVGALYYARSEPYHPIVMVPHPRWPGPDGPQDLLADESVWRGEWEGGKIVFAWPSLEDQFVRDPGLQRVCVVGAGCLAIRRDVLEDWPKDRPCFAFETSGDGGQIGEDVYFCRECARRGIPVYLDSGIVLPHMVVSEVTRETYRGHLRKRVTAGLRLPPPR